MIKRIAVILILLLSALSIRAQNIAIETIDININHAFIAGNLSWSPDERLLAFQNIASVWSSGIEDTWYYYDLNTKSLTVGDVYPFDPQLTDEELAKTNMSPYAIFPNLTNLASSDGKYVIYGPTPEADQMEFQAPLSLFNRETGEVHQLDWIVGENNKGSDWFNAVWSEDSSAILLKQSYEGYLTYIYIWDYEPILQNATFKEVAKTRFQINGLTYNVHLPFDLSGDGRFILMQSWQDDASVELALLNPINPDKSRIITYSQLQTKRLYNAKFWNGINSKIIYINRQGIYLHDTNTNLNTLVYAGFDATLYNDIVFSPSGEKIAMRDRSQNVYLLDLTSVFASIEDSDCRETNTCLIQNIRHHQGHNYTLDTGLAVGDTVFADRPDTFTEVDPALLGAEFIQTQNSDKQQNETPTLSFKLSKDATVYVAVDNRHPAPAWLSGWQQTAYNLVSSDGNTSLSRTVYARAFPAGEVHVGGSACPATGDCQAYTILANTTPPPPISCDSTIAAGDEAGLVQAITQANSQAGAATLCLTQGRYEFESVALWEQGPNALPKITDDLTIIGNGATLTRADSRDNARFALVGQSGQLTIRNAIFEQGKTYDNGGAFRVDGTLILDGVTIKASSAEKGGALYAASGATLTLLNSTLENNQTGYDDGGAIFNGGTLQVTNSSFKDNQSGNHGGVIYNDKGTVTVVESRFSQNQTQNEGGVLYNSSDGNVTIADSTFTDNKVSEDDGGAIDNHGTLTIARSTFDGNQSLQDDGGAIWTDTGTMVTISDSTFINNSAADDGGAIMSFGVLKLTGKTRFQDNTAAADGGAISADTGRIEMVGGDFIHNTATHNGGAIIAYTPVTLQNVTLNDNRAGDKGGALYLFDTMLTLNTASQLLNNRAGSDGGALYVDANHAAASATTTINKATFKGNVTDARGGAIYVGKGTHSIQNSFFERNQATGQGGAIYTDTNLTIQDKSLFTNNQSGDDGGAIYAYNHITIQTTTFIDNRAVDQGGAFRGFVSASSSLLNSCISGNSAGDTGGVYSGEDGFNAGNNWWGNASGPSGAGTGRGDAVNSGVNFANFITTDCQSALAQPSAQTQARAARAAVQDVLSTRNTDILTSIQTPYSDSFDEAQTDWLGSGRWSWDKRQAWWIDTRVRGQSSTLEMTTWLTADYPGRLELFYAEQAQLASVDTVTIQIQTQGEREWTTLLEASGGQFDWQQRSIDLSAYSGQTFRLRWRITVPADQPIGEQSQVYALDDVSITHVEQ